MAERYVVAIMRNVLLLMIWYCCLFRRRRNRILSWDSDRKAHLGGKGKVNEGSAATSPRKASVIGYEREAV